MRMKGPLQLVLLFAATLPWAAAAHAQTVRPDFFVTNGTVNAQALSGTTLYVGGSFTSVGAVTGSGVPVDSATGVAHAGFPRVNGQIVAAIPDGAGGWYIGGSFTEAGGLARLNVARVLADDSVSPWNPGANGIVRALAVAGGAVYLGGDFTTVAGLARSRIAAVDTVTGTPTGWNPSADNTVRAIAVDGGAVFVGGLFTAIGGQTRNRIAALDAASGLAMAWNPNANSSVFALATSGGTVYAGGQFTIVNGQTRNRVAAIDAASGSATTWNPGANSPVLALAVGDGTIYVGGQFTSAGGQTRNRIAALDAATGFATAWNPGASSTVQSLALRGATLYVGGDFTSIGGRSRSRVAAVDVATGLATAWDPTAYAAVSVVAVDGTGVFVGGLFGAVGGVPRSNLAAFDLATGQATAWTPNADGAVQALALGHGVVYAGGVFTQAGGLPRLHVAALDTALGAPTAWDPGTDGTVSALAVDGDVVYVGGTFGTAGGQPRSNLAAVHAGTGLVTAWDPAADDQVFTIARGTGGVYVGGSFTSVGGQARSFIAALDAATGLATAWAPEASGTVRVIANACDRLYVGGFFSSVGGQARDWIAALDPATALATAWNPGANGPVYDIAPAGGVVYVAGVLNYAGGQPRNRIAALDPLTGLATAWNPNCSGTVRSLAVGGGWVYAAGTFTAMGTAPSGNLAAITADTSQACPAVSLTPPPLATGVVGTPYTQSLAATGGAAPYCYAVTAGTLPNGLSLSTSTGGISGTPTAAGLGVFSVTATDARGCTGTRGYTLTIFAGPSVSSIAAEGAGLCLTPGRPCVGVPVTYTRGDSAPLRDVSVTFQLETSMLALCTPAAPSLSIHAGTWSGGYGNARTEVTDNGGGSYTVDQTLLGEPCGITTGGQLFVVDLAAMGPDGAGAVTVTSVEARDCSGVPVAVSAGPAASVNVLGTPIAVVPASPPAAVAGTPYAQALGATAGTAPFSYAVTTGTLPAGLTLSPGGMLAGTPTRTGDFSFSVTVTDAGGCSGASTCSLAVVCAAVALSPALLPNGVAGLVYSQAITATAGVAPFHFAVTAGALPAGLALSPTGLLSGTPTAAGSAAFTVGVVDSAGCAGSRDYVLDVFATPPVSSVAANTAGLCISTVHPVVSVPFEFTRGESTPALGLTVTFSIDESMLSLRTPATPAASIHAGTWFGGFTNGRLLVTDRGGGSYTVDAILLGPPCGVTTGGVLFTVDLRSTAEDGQGQITVTQARGRDCNNAPIPLMAGAPAALRILNAPVPISPATLPDAFAGRPYEQALSADAGEPPFTFGLADGALPPGLALSPAGVLSGAPLATGSFAFTVQVSDGAGCPGSRGYTLLVRCPAIAVLPPVLPGGAVGAAYGQALTATGGIPPYRFAVAGGTLPDGLTLSDDGLLSGTPTTPGTTILTIGLTDSAGCPGTRDYVLDVFATPPVSAVAANTAGLCLSAARPCVSVPVEFSRGESIPALGITVTLEIDASKLSLCTPATPAASIHAGTWFGGLTNGHLMVTDNGGGSYTVDAVLLGPPCGITTGGVLFTVDLHALGGDGNGTITVQRVRARDCGNAPIPVVPGPAASLPIDNTVPAAIVDLAATPVLTGNASAPTFGIALTWGTGGVGTVRLYRAPFGAYPLYDALGTVTPPDPAAAPAAPWTLVAADAAPGYVDRAAPRGFWHYVALRQSDCGVLSAASNLTGGTLDYLLGDVSDGATQGSGNGRVGMEDVTLLGAHYGSGADTIGARGIAYLDVGPTVGGALDGRPLPDRQLDFEDLFVFAGNFGVRVTDPQSTTGAASLASAGTDEPEQFRLDAPSLVIAGQTVTATLVLRGAGRIQGLSARLAWDARIVEPLGMRPGALVLDQGGLVLSPRPGTVDAVLLGRRERGIVGQGEVATVTFRALRTGEAGIQLAALVLRDAANRTIPTAEVTLSSRPERPAETVLLAPSPNPLRAEVTLTFALAEPGPVELVVYGVDGRHVRGLAGGWREAGVYRAVWDARDDRGRPVAPGVYYARFTGGGRRLTATMVRLR
jgi:trimeric autotransporter adhesin